MQTRETTKPTGYDTHTAKYDTAHARWLRHAGGEAQCAFEGAVTATLQAEMTVLDAACGTGTVPRRLLSNAVGPINLVLLDNSKQMLAQCHDIAATSVQGCLKSLPFKSNNFDVVTCAWGLETLDQPDKGLAELIRVTRTGAHIFIVFCADRAVQSLIGAALSYRISSTGRGRFLDPEMIQTQALALGAKTVQPLHCTGPAFALMLRN